MSDARIRKQSVNIRGHRTSITLEDTFMNALRTMAAQRHLSVAALIAEIDGNQSTPGNLSSAIRVAVLEWAIEGGANRPSPQKQSDET
ncbi:ribbon-helix-helix domain-containing protein [Hoeflea algicola]|nr:ribbon-helix-helix domain-containing protein [Hoeflea algicola]